MIVPDTNLLVYAYNVGAPEHEIARLWWEGLVNGEETIGLPWVVTTGFVRVVSSNRVVSSPFSPVEAAEIVDEWFRYPHILPIDPGSGHMDLFRDFLGVPGSGANLVPDAHIAALATEYEAEVHSRDTDFGRFPGVRWYNPFA